MSKYLCLYIVLCVYESACVSQMPSDSKSFSLQAPLPEANATFVPRYKPADGIWVFPKIMVPPNHPILIGFFIINHPFWGVSPYFWFNIHMWKYQKGQGLVMSGPSTTKEKYVEFHQLQVVISVIFKSFLEQFPQIL